VRGRVDAVHLGHLHVEDHEVGLELGRHRDGLLAVGRLTGDVVALFLEHLDEVEPDERFIFRDEDTALHGRAGLGLGSLLGHRRSSWFLGYCGNPSLPASPPPPPTSETAITKK
jgi:hypothetical protein